MAKGELAVSIGRDSNDVGVVITGTGLEEPLPHIQILDITKLTGDPKALRLTGLTFAVEKGLALFLWWDDGKKDTLILPVVEGQGRLDLESIGGLHNPRRDAWTGHVELSTKHTSEGEKNFMLALSFAKVRD